MRTSALFLLLTACSGATGSLLGNTVTGSVEGKSLSPGEAIAVTAQVKVDGNNVVLARVGLFDRTGTCSMAMQGQEAPNTKALILEVRHEDLSTMPPAIAPGTYTIGTSLDKGYFEYVVARFAATDGACHDTIARGNASTGRITIDAIDAKGIRGSYSVRLDSGDALNGVFDAPTCDVPVPTETSCAR
jgi:hypothetical protein